MNAADILEHVRENVVSHGTVAVSVSIPRPWTTIAACSFDGNDLLIEMPTSFPAFTFGKHPRVSFCIGRGGNVPEIQGNGIAYHIKDDVNRIRIAPYRISINPSRAPGSTNCVIEKRQNVWRLRQRQPDPAASRGMRFWFRAVRGVSFPLSIFPILIGTSCALLAGPVDWLLFAMAMAGGVAAHAATNLFSDYSDFVNGVDTTNALSSHTGVLVDELAGPGTIVMAAAACGLVTAFTGGVLLVMVGWPILIFGIAGLLGGFFYSGGSRAFKYIGYGEAATGFLMGPLMVCGAYFVQTRTLPVPVFLLSIAVGLLVSAVSYGNNVRDAFFDGQAGITTMPVRLGARPALLLFRTMIAMPYLLVGCAVCLDMRFLPALAVLLSTPWAIVIAVRFGQGAQDFTGLSEQAARCILPLQVIRLHTKFCLFLLVGCASASIIVGKLL